MMKAQNTSEFYTPFLEFEGTKKFPSSKIKLIKRSNRKI